MDIDRNLHTERRASQVTRSKHTIAQIDDDRRDEVRPVDAPLCAVLLVIFLHCHIEHVELDDREPAVILDVLTLEALVTPATARCWVGAIAEAFAPDHVLLAARLVAREHRYGHWAPTDFDNASSCEVVTERVEVALVVRVVDQLAHRDPLLEQIGHAAIANAPHCEREAAHALACDTIVLEAARPAGEGEDRTPWPLIRWADAVHDLLGDPIRLVGALGILRRHELPDVQ